MNVRYDPRGCAHVTSTDEFMTPAELEEAIGQLALVYFRIRGALPPAPSFKSLGIDKAEVTRMRAREQKGNFSSAVASVRGGKR